jgi:hypothetical protein
MLNVREIYWQYFLKLYYGNNMLIKLANYCALTFEIKYYLFILYWFLIPN